MKDVQTLLTWIRVVETIAAVCTTAVPVIYFFTGWNTRTLGRLFMWQATSSAAAKDAAVIFMFWRPKTPGAIVTVLWLDAVILTAIAGSTFSLAFYILLLNRFRKKDSGEIH
jgi:hypothetical protein